MKDIITSKLEDVRRVVVKLRIFTVMVDCIIVFIFSSIIFVLMGFEAILAIAPTVFYLVFHLIFPIKDRDVIGIIIQKSPFLNERLQTAYDNRKKSNLIMDRLVLGISQDLNDLQSSMFVEGRGLLVRISVIIFLLFTLLTINFFHIKDVSLDLQRDIIRKISTVSSPAGTGRDSSGSGSEWERSGEGSKDEREKTGGESGGKIPGFNKGPLPGMGGGGGEGGENDIYGAPASARIGGQDVDMEVHSEYGGEIEIKDMNERRMENVFKILEDIRSAGTPEQEPVKYEGVIRRYFEKLSKTEEK